jgi:hypothetical protein
LLSSRFYCGRDVSAPLGLAGTGAISPGSDRNPGWAKGLRSGGGLFAGEPLPEGAKDLLEEGPLEAVLAGGRCGYTPPVVTLAGN